MLLWPDLSDQDWQNHVDVKNLSKAPPRNEPAKGTMSDPVFFPLPPKPSVLWAIIIWQSLAVSHLHFLCKSRLRAQSPWAAPGPLWSSPPGSCRGWWSSSCSRFKLTNSLHCPIQHLQTQVQFLCIAHLKLRNSKLGYICCCSESASRLSLSNIFFLLRSTLLSNESDVWQKSDVKILAN